MKLFSQFLMSELNRQLEIVYLEMKNPLHHSDHETSHEFLIAKILANDLIRVFLEEEIEKLEHKVAISQKSASLTKSQKWTGSKVALIELIYALHTEGVFNNGTSELKELASLFESAFDIELGQFHRVFLEIRNRKSERTKFLNTLRSRLIIRMDNADEN